MLAKCGLTTDHIESLMKVLSGGENAKVRLCKIMNREANVLVLDEPTNHLDSETICWLEEYFKKSKGALLMITHDPEEVSHYADRNIHLVRKQNSPWRCFNVHEKDGGEDHA